MGLVDKFKTYFTRQNTVVKYHETQIFEAFSATYDAISLIARCVDLITNTCASVPYKIVDDKGLYNVDVTFPQFEKLLDEPSFDNGRYDFMRLYFRDLVYSGNAFYYNLGNELQHLSEVNYTPDNTVRSGEQKLDSDRLIHTKLLRDVGSKYGISYISRIDKELDLIANMLTFQKNLFKNGGVPGVILSTENPLNLKQKERIAEEYLDMYAIAKGNTHKPFISDNGLKFESLTHSFKELEFSEGVKGLNGAISTGLGIPEVLLSSGNNANILPNYKLFVYNTVAPFVDNFAAELTLHLHKFYKKTKDMKVVAKLESLPLLQDDTLKRNNSVKTLVTTGICTINESRAMLGLPPSTEEVADMLLPPANITGSLFDASPGTPNEGGNM